VRGGVGMSGEGTARVPVAPGDKGAMRATGPAGWMPSWASGVLGRLAPGGGDCSPFVCFVFPFLFIYFLFCFKPF
jgi:hypothetical protein